MISHKLWLALSLAVALIAAAPAGAQTPAAPAADAVAAANEPIGNVATLSGIATVIRNKNSLPLHLRDDIFLNDQLQTSSNSSLGITFNDATTFNLSANAKITVDTYIYEDGGKQNAGIFDIGRGTVAFVAAAVAKTGDMKITTPTSTLGIRGTTGLVEVPEGGTAAGGAANGENIKLYPDADGHVGRIEVSDHTGQRLGALTQGASGFTVRPGVGGARPIVQALRISPQQVARDQSFVRQVHAAQSVGRQIVTEQRAARRANPPARPNQPRQNQTPGQNRGGQQQPGKPGEKAGAKPGEKPGAKTNTKQGTQTPTQPKAGEKKPESKPGTKPAARKPTETKPEPKPGTPPSSRERQGAAPQPRDASPLRPPAPEPTLRQGGATPPAAIAPRPGAPRFVPQRPKGPPGKREKKRP